MLLRLAYLGITNVFALLRLLPGSGRDEDAEILARRHQLAMLQRQLGGQWVRLPISRAPQVRVPQVRAPSTLPSFHPKIT